MYAVVDVAGSQYKVQEGDRIRVSRLSSEAGDKLTFDNILLLGGGENLIGELIALLAAMCGNDNHGNVGRHDKRRAGDCGC